MKKFQRGNRDTLIVFSRPWFFFDLHSQVCCCSQPETCCRRPYRVECTGSLLTSEVKQRRARSVLGWGTAWEDLRVLSAFSFLIPRVLCSSSRHQTRHMKVKMVVGSTVLPIVLHPVVHFLVASCCTTVLVAFDAEIGRSDKTCR